MSYTLSELQKLTRRVLIWRVKIMAGYKCGGIAIIKQTQVYISIYTLVYNRKSDSIYFLWHCIIFCPNTSVSAPLDIFHV